MGKKDKKLKEKQEKKLKDQELKLENQPIQENNSEKKKKKKKKNKDKNKNKPEIENLEKTKKIQKTESKQQDEEKVEYPYEVDQEDHCETPLQAYKDILPMLISISFKIGKQLKDLKIYDPYYCQGRVVENLKSIGLENIYNKKEDFYKVIENNKVPEYDVLVTNPPYSEDHIKKILEFCVKQKKPWFLLVPNYVYTKDYYLESMKLSEPWCKPFYVCPNERYFYLKEGKQTSPFVSFWYIYLQNQQNDILDHCRNLIKNSKCEIVKNLHKLPQNMKDSNDPTRKKLRKNQRDSKKKNKPKN